MKETSKVLIYGDSIIYGLVPRNINGNPRVQFSKSERIGGIAQTLLGEDVEIIEEGLRGRMLGGENTFFPHRNGIDQFGPIFASHAPVDIVVFALGTNDCNAGTNPNYDYISHAFDTYISQVQWRCQSFGLKEPQYLIVCPLHIKDHETKKIFGEIFAGADDKVTASIEYMKKYAQEHHITCLDLNHMVQSSNDDGIHLDIIGNQQFAQALATAITQTLATS